MSFQSIYLSDQIEDSIGKIVDAIVLPYSLLSLTSSSSSEEIAAVLGATLDGIASKVQQWKINQGVIDSVSGSSIPVSISCTSTEFKFSCITEEGKVIMGTITLSNTTYSADIRSSFANVEISIPKPLDEFTSETDSELMDIIVESAKNGLHSALVYKSEDGNTIHRYVFSGYDDSSSGSLVNKTASYILVDDFANIKSYAIQLSIILGAVSGRAVVKKNFVNGEVVTESEYAALGASVNTDGKVYFVIPDTL